ncbi:MAG: Isoleucyl-tRNA synthetase [Acidobacteriales bacterium]|nr:Isoleucyl-tRNA synthetase [Terriglobales bacterium]
MGAPPELKATLNLPKTDFPMKANLPQNEPKWLERWESLRIYDRIRDARKDSPSYVLHDGPPYANGPIHLGHALNKCLKDFVVKSKTMLGFDSPYVPGWDCHGLPIEIKVDESLGRKKLEMKPVDVRQACREYATKYLDLQREQFKRIGVFGDWDHPYSTMSKEYESTIVKTFYEFFERGSDLVYKGLKPVYWCINDRTALAEAEIEYAQHTSPSVYVKYALTSDPANIDVALAGKKVSTIIWTTTPWTLPASMAVAFHPDYEYVALESKGEVYIVAEALAEPTKKITSLEDAVEVAKFRGKKLEYATFAHPFLDRSILGVLATYVTTDQGTGAVHTAPSHGADDFYTGVKYKLDQTCNVDNAGRLRNGLPEYDGKTVFQANEPIVELLKSRGALLGSGKIEHSYPHCWRCHKPVIFRATEQWFISMEGKVDDSTLRQRALDEIKNVKWDPAWGEERISNMIATRPDWCISRQRIWGVPIAVFFCASESCNEMLRSKEANQRVVELFAKEGADAWYVHEPSEILPAGTKCAKCGGSEFRKEMDIIDVWFESGSSNAAVLGKGKLHFPADLYFEGGDQHRGWFHSSLLCSVGTRDHAPYKKVSTSGWTLDPTGKAMSKSLGNVVDPVDIARRLGGEIVRLWVASVDFREDVHASEELMQRVAENYRKIRNTFKNMLGNLYDFDPSKPVAFADMDSLDQYMLMRTAELSERVQNWYDEMLFHRVYHEVHNFCAVDLSNIYFDVIKDRLYTSAPNSRARRSAQTAIWRIAEALVRLIAPIISFTSDEIWQNMPKVEGRSESVHLELFPQPHDIYGKDINVSTLEALRRDWTLMMSVRDEALKALETARQSKEIGSSLEAQLKISAPESTYETLSKYAQQLRFLLIVSGVTVEKAAGGNGSAALHVEVSRAAGEKCERCWNYSVHVGENKEYPMICERCSASIQEIAKA